MVDRFRREFFEMKPNENGSWVNYSDYAALEAQLAERVKVKQLEWEEIRQRRSDEDPTTEWNGGYEADSALGYYEISMGFGSDAYYWTVSDPLSKDIGSDFDDPSDAKAAAQADYERRILSALEATPPAPKVTEAMISAGLENYSEGGCMGLDEHEVLEVVEAIIHAALTASQEAGKP